MPKDLTEVRKDLERILKVRLGDKEVIELNRRLEEAYQDSRYFAEFEAIKKEYKIEEKKLVPVISAGEYLCEEDKCGVVQTGEEKENVLFYGNDMDLNPWGGMYCKEHIEHHLI